MADLDYDEAEARARREAIELQTNAVNALTEALTALVDTTPQAGEVLSEVRFTTGFTTAVTWQADFIRTIDSSRGAAPLNDGATADARRASRRYTVLGAWCKEFTVGKRSPWLDGPHAPWPPEAIPQSAATPPEPIAGPAPAATRVGS